MEEIYDAHASKKMGIDHEGQVCVMIHSGSRGMGHQVATGKFMYKIHCETDPVSVTSCILQWTSVY